MTTRAEVVMVARSWLHPITPYVHQASKRGVGADCIGFVGGVALALGLPGAAAWAADIAVHSYGKKPDAKMLVAACYRYLVPLPTISAAGLADILVFRFDAEGEPQHFALISSLSPMRIIHAYAVAHRVAENNIEDRYSQNVTWRSLIVSAWRFQGLDD